MDKNHIFFKSEYGFRENCSTQHATLDIQNKIQNNIYFHEVFSLNSNKAFDTVDHQILLHKLYNLFYYYGIRGSNNKCLVVIILILSGRTQLTQIGSTAFSKENVVCGVPQGSMFMTSIAPLKSLIFTCLVMTLKLGTCGERSINQSRNSHHL